jgi:hypothetical protein
VAHERHKSERPDPAGDLIDTAKRGFAQAFSEEVGTTVGRAVGLLSMATASGLLAQARREDPGFLFFALVFVAAACALGVLVVALRVRLTKLVKRQSAKLSRAHGQIETLEARVSEERAQKDRLNRMLRHREDRERRLTDLVNTFRTALEDERQHVRQVGRRVSRLVGYAHIRLEMLTTISDECAHASNGLDRDRVLDGVLSTARSALCQERGSATRLAVVRDGTMSRDVLHSAGARRRQLQDASRPLSEIVKSLGETSLIVDFGINERDHLVVTAEGELTSEDCDFAREVASIYALADVALKDSRRELASGAERGGSDE